MDQITTSDDPVIRRAKFRDLTAMEWGGEFVHFRRLYRDIYQSSIKGNSILWLAETSTAGIVGQLFVQLRSMRIDLADGYNRAYIFGFRVKKNFQKRGVGSIILEASEADLRTNGYHYVTLNVSKTNIDALKFYQHRGYVVIGKDPGIWSYYNHLGEFKRVNDPGWCLEKQLV
jgi:ribosomal protein S18 acetylase RimI-like enzyme